MTVFARMLVVSAALAGCAGPSKAVPQAPLTQKQFVDVMVELGLEPGKQADILRKHGTTAKELRAFVNAYAESPALLGVTFDTIQVRIDRGVLLLPDQNNGSPP